MADREGLYDPPPNPGSSQGGAGAAGRGTERVVEDMKKVGRFPVPSITLRALAHPAKAADNKPFVWPSGWMRLEEVVRCWITFLALRC